jgi:hypothetical protein
MAVTIVEALKKSMSISSTARYALSRSARRVAALKTVSNRRRFAIPVSESVVAACSSCTIKSEFSSMGSAFEPAAR